MKNLFKSIFIFMLFMVASLGIISCGGDDDELTDLEGQEIVEGRWTEEGNQLIYKISYDYGYGMSYNAVWTLTFEGDTCTNSQCACTFSSSQMADIFYASWGEKEEYPAVKSGKTVTVNWTTAHKGLSKTEVKNAIGAMEGL